MVALVFEGIEGLIPDFPATVSAFWVRASLLASENCAKE
jgi:hypothetical protein